MFVNLGRTLFYRKLEPFQREIVLILQPSRCLRIHRGPSVKQKRSWKCSENGGSCARKQAQGGGCALVAAKSCCADVGSRPMPTVCPQNQAARSSALASSVHQARDFRAAFACCTDSLPAERAGARSVPEQTRIALTTRCEQFAPQTFR